MSENVLWVNPRTASAQGLKNGQEVWLENQDGLASLYPIKLRVTERIRWDSVYMAHGFGHNNPKLTLAHGHGASDSDLISKAMIDPIMGGTGMRGNFVRILTEKPTEEAKA
jgi:thiosulfate reductase/polysulfide reductase chain A